MIQQLDDHHDYFTEGCWTMAAERDNWGSFVCSVGSCQITVVHLQ